MTPGLAVEALRFGYRGRAVGGPVSFTVAPGEVLCLLGPNGGGKTTLFKTVLGLLPPIAGRIAMDGEDIARLGSPRRRARTIGYVPQSAAGQFPFTVHEMVLMGRIAHRGAFAAPTRRGPCSGGRERWRRWASPRSPRATGCGSAAASGSLRSSRARLRRSRASWCSTSPPPISISAIRCACWTRSAGSPADGLAVVFSTHHPEQAFACATHVALLHDGALMRIGTPDATITSETMKLLYGMDVDIVGVGGAMKACIPRVWRQSRAGPGV